MNDALSVPSPRRFWSTLGMRSAARNASANRDVPKKCAKTRSLSRAAIRLKRMTPAAVRAERADGCSSAPSVAPFTRWKLIGRPPFLQQPAQELALLLEPLDLGAEPLGLGLQRRDARAQPILAGQAAPLHTSRKRAPQRRVQHRCNQR